MLSVQLRQIISKSAGTYFIVTNKSQVATIEAENKMRLYFINSPVGPVNTLFQFAKGDKTGFTSVFGKANRSMEKKGNFSHQVCLDSLTAGPIAVINIRAFDDELDICETAVLNPNRTLNTANTEVPYRSLFNYTSFWSPKPKNLENIENFSDDFLQFGNVGTNNTLSIFVVKSTKASDVTNQSEETIGSTSLAIEEYPLLLAKPEMLIKDTFVDVYVFNNSFENANTNPSYGHLFNNQGKLDLSNIDELTLIPESGYKQTFTGSIIPNLKSEADVDISIDTVINQYYMTTGLLCNINEAVLESDSTDLLDVYGQTIYNVSGGYITEVGKGKKVYSHVGPDSLTTATTAFPPTHEAQLTIVPANIVEYQTTNFSLVERSFCSAFEQGLRVGDILFGNNDTLCRITGMEFLSEETVEPYGESSFTYQKIKYTYTGDILLSGQTPVVKKYTSFVTNGLIEPTTLSSYNQRPEQFLDGSSAKQTEILNMINNPGIVKGIVATTGIRYVVDCFKSFVEADYKSQFGNLMVSLDEAKRFVRAIINEPFVEDLEKSTNPLFKQTPSGAFEWSYVKEGGNKNYSSKFLTKFNTGSEFCFFFGPGNVVGSVTKPMSGLVSNLFYSKRYPFDVVANDTGIVDGITELESSIDDTDRAYCEAFRYNPIINFNNANRIFGNNSGTSTKTSQQQIQNSELLAYIKESLYNLSKGEAFKKGNYDDYLRTETQGIKFFEGLFLAGAIESDFKVICNATNNDAEIKKQRLKRVGVSYTPTDCLEKVVFEIEIK